MKQGLSLLIPLFCLSFIDSISPNAVLAQVTPDGTTSTTVDANGNNLEINDGDRAGDNLFHSFDDFSVPNGGEAFFNNAADIVNIFSRVTGGNISNIDGLIRANGGASLFLINPAGIVFGENASLDIGGSFYGSSADSILFEDGEFSATDLENPPLLTINAPIGLSFRDEPGDITVRGNGQGTRTTNELIDTEEALRVGSNQTFALVGGNINLEGATIKTLGGRIELASVEGNERVNLTSVAEGFSLGYEGVQNFRDIQLSQAATVDAGGLVAGDIRLQGKNITLTEGSQIGSSTVGTSLSQDTPGIVEINAIDTITIDGVNPSNDVSSGIFSQVDFDAVGNASDLNITTGNLTLTNSGSISSSGTSGEGDAGAIDIIATGDLTINGESQGNFLGSSSINIFGETGNNGRIKLSTTNLTLINGGEIIASAGVGDVAEIDITATGDITIGGESQDGVPSSIRSFTGTDNDGGIKLSTTNLTLTNRGVINANAGEGDAGAIDITATGDITIDGSSSNIGNDGEIKLSTTNLTLTNGGRINAIAGERDAGAIDITATEDITIDGGSIDIFSFAETGNTGGIKISTTNLTLTNGGLIDAIAGERDAGAIDITATGDITIDGSSINNFAETGNTGGINLSTTNLTLTNGGQIAADTVGSANASNLNIDVSNILKVEGVDSGLFSRTGGTGDAGTVNINAAQLQVNNNAQVGVNNFVETQLQLETLTDPSGRTITRTVRVFDPVEGSGNAGTIEINADTIRLQNGGNLTAISGGGDGGDIDIDSNLLVLSDGGKVAAEAALEDIPGSGGNINIDSTLIAAFPDGNNDITANAFSGTGGNINIVSEGIFGIEERALGDFTNDINASSQQGAQFDGTVAITTPEVDALRGVTQLPDKVVEAEQTTDEACSNNSETGEPNGLTVRGRGGMPATPFEPLEPDNIIIDGEVVVTSHPEIKPILTNNGPIYPAMGVLQTPDGQTILTGYPTDNVATRTPTPKKNCRYSTNSVSD
jgi:filamentous hemagglutinin family protein